MRPRFIPTDSPPLLELAGRLLQVYEDEPAPTRGEVTETTQAITASASDPVLARGLNKILLDRCDFSHADKEDYPATREALFQASGRLLADQLPEDAETFRHRVFAEAGVGSSQLKGGIYADLPENERLQHFRRLTPREVLERYNVGLVQALLLRAESLEVIASSPDPAKMRRMFKYLKFFRLLARLYEAPAQGSDDGEGQRRIRIVIDGPGSVLSKPKRYGLQLASFFPAVCALDEWSVDTSVAWKGAARRLRLTQASGLVSHYRNFSAYVPEEVKLFHRHFDKTVSHWRIVGQTPFLSAGGQQIIFPDLSFASDDGAGIHLELFHRWHAGQLLERLKMASEQRHLPLIVGVDRALLKDSAVEAACEESTWFQDRGFLFRDYPSVDRAVACLDRTAMELTSGVETEDEN